jgi:hypothetical protein
LRSEKSEKSYIPRGSIDIAIMPFTTIVVRFHINVIPGIICGQNTRFILRKEKIL